MQKTVLFAVIFIVFPRFEVHKYVAEASKVRAVMSLRAQNGIDGPCGSSNFGRMAGNVGSNPAIPEKLVFVR